MEVEEPAPNRNITGDDVPELSDACPELPDNRGILPNKERYAKDVVPSAFLCHNK
jgi:hypothetical protein